MSYILYILIALVAINIIYLLAVEISEIIYFGYRFLSSDESDLNETVKDILSKFETKEIHIFKNLYMFLNFFQAYGFFINEEKDIITIKFLPLVYFSLFRGRTNKISWEHASTVDDALDYSNKNEAINMLNGIFRNSRVKTISLAKFIDRPYTIIVDSNEIKFYFLKKNYLITGYHKMKVNLRNIDLENLKELIILLNNSMVAKNE